MAQLHLGKVAAWLFVASTAVAAGGVMPITTDLDFRFAAPPGWISLAKGAPKKNFVTAGDFVAEQARARDFAAFYVEVRDGAAFAYFSALVIPVSEQVTPGSVDAFVASMMRGHEDVQSVVSKEVTSIKGVNAVRVVTTGIGSDLTQATYMIPGTRQSALLTFTCSKEDFRSYEPIFAGIAGATEGVAEPPFDLAKYGRPSALFGEFIGRLVVTFVLTLMVRRVWRKRIGPAFAASAIALVIAYFGKSPEPLSGWDLMMAGGCAVLITLFSGLGKKPSSSPVPSKPAT